MSETTGWYVVKTDSDVCQIMPASQISSKPVEEQWGPYNTQGEAIAKRVGLIRAGKCQPVS